MSEVLKNCFGMRAQGTKNEEVIEVALTRDFKHTVVECAQRGPEFATAMLDEAAMLFLNGEPKTARLILRELVNATVGFEELALGRPSPVRACIGCSLPEGIQAWTIWRPSSAQSAGTWGWESKSAP